MSVPTPLNFFGSKTKLAPQIVRHFPPHRTYVEVFAGGASVLLSKSPSAVEVYNDIDKQLVTFFRVLRDPELCAKLRIAAEDTLYSRAEFELAKQACSDPVEAARRFLVRHRMSHGGRGEHWSYSVATSRRRTAAAIRRWQWGVESLPAIHQRLKGVQIECSGWRSIFERFDREDSLFYADPPYHPSTRIAGSYRHELTHHDHCELVAFLLSVQGMVVLSGYANETYRVLERAGWARIDYPTCTHVSGSLTRRVESLWLSPSVALAGRTPISLLSPTERMSRGACHAHKVMVAATTKRLIRAVGRLRAAGKKPTATRLARATKMSREHLVRKYRHLFAAPKV